MKAIRYFDTIRQIGKGFTLAEVLIALSLLGIVAAFSIPKILGNSGNTRDIAIAKEAAAMVSEAYEQYQLHKGAPKDTTGMVDLLPYMNYVTIIADGVTTVDYEASSLIHVVCGGVGNNHMTCLKLHNGGVLYYTPLEQFGGPNLPDCSGTTPGPNNALWFIVDPDGTQNVPDGTPDGPGKGVAFFLYFDGNVTSYATIFPNTCTRDGAYIRNPVPDPSWFSWN